MRWYLEKAEDVWHPTVATVPRTAFPIPSVECPDRLSDKRLNSDMIMIFLKRFDPESQSLLGWRSVYVQLGDKMGTLQGIIADMLGHNDNLTGVTELEMYEEVRPGTIERVIPARTFYGNEMYDGDIIVFGPKISSKRYHPSPGET